MSITFKCPKCGSICGFTDRYAGRRARCMTCQKNFIIPDADGGEAMADVEESKEVLPGFYRRCLVDSWKIFIDPQNAKALIFVAAMAALEFFVGFTDFSSTFSPNGIDAFRFQMPLGIITVIITRGCLFCYYLEIIATTAFEVEELPDVELGSGFEFFGNIFKSMYLFIVAMLVVQIPFVILTTILDSLQVPLPLFVTVPMMLVGTLVFPIAILTIAAGREMWMVFHFGYLTRPIIKAFRPYLVAAGLTAASVFVELMVLYETMGGFQRMIGKGYAAVALGLIACISARYFTVVAMRSIGLFGLHHRCYLPQVHVDE